MTREEVRALALSLPGVEEGPCYGTAGFRVRRKLLGRLPRDGETLVLAVDPDTRDFLMRRRSGIFHLTDHYRNYPYVLVRLAAIEEPELRQYLEQAWRRHAPKRLVASHDRSTE